MFFPLVIVHTRSVCLEEVFKGLSTFPGTLEMVFLLGHNHNCV